MDFDPRPASRFDAQYEGEPPWDIGRPQPALLALADAGEFRGAVLDVGCGTGELAIELARRGHEAWGIDSSSVALAKAEAKARARGVDVTFRFADALDLGGLGRTFDTAVDSAVFHVFTDEERARYAASLARAIVPGGAVYLLVFSDREPTEWGGPRRIHAHDFGRTFRDGWRVRWIREARLVTRFEHHAAEGGGVAWLASIERLST